MAALDKDHPLLIGHTYKRPGHGEFQFTGGVVPSPGDIEQVKYLYPLREAAPAPGV